MHSSRIYVSFLCQQLQLEFFPTSGPSTVLSLLFCRDLLRGRGWRQGGEVESRPTSLKIYRDLASSRS